MRRGSVVVQESVETARANLPSALRSTGVFGDASLGALWRAVLLEFLASGFFVFHACGTVVAADAYGLSTAATNLFAALIQGFSIASFVYATSRISGGHLNPAVTFSLLITQHIGVVRGVFYIIAQLVGAIVGAGVLKAVIPKDHQYTLGATMLGNGISPGQGFLFEFVVTSGLLFVIYGTAMSRDQAASGIAALSPIPIGYAVTIGVGIAYSFTGGSLNPARSFGPAIVMDIWTHHWIYWVGPVGAAIVLGVIERYVRLASFAHEPTPGCNKEIPDGINSKMPSHGPAHAFQVILEPGTAPVAMIPMTTDPNWDMSVPLVTMPSRFKFKKNKAPAPSEARLETTRPAESDPVRRTKSPSPPMHRHSLEKQEGSPRPLDIRRSIVAPNGEVLSDSYRNGAVASNGNLLSESSESRKYIFPNNGGSPSAAKEQREKRRSISGSSPSNSQSSIQ